MSTPFETKLISKYPNVTAPDGADVRILLQLKGGSMAHFELAPGKTSRAVAHRTIEEIWYFTQGEGEMWRKQGDKEEITPVAAGVCITIPVGTHFQFHATGKLPLAAIAITMPPWPGDGEVYYVSGAWLPDLS